LAKQLKPSVSCNNARVSIRHQAFAASLNFPSLPSCFRFLFPYPLCLFKALA